jgi:hypothetical protein
MVVLLLTLVEQEDVPQVLSWRVLGQNHVHQANRNPGVGNLVTVDRIK